MKKKTLIIIIVCLLLSIILFAGLWLHERADRSDVRLLAQAGASDALRHFENYRDLGHESSYWYGVADFRSFEQAYYLLTENTNKSANYTFCNEVYGNLVLYPERSQQHINEIIEAMELLANDVEDENGYLAFASLRYSMTE